MMTVDLSKCSIALRRPSSCRPDMMSLCRLTGRAVFREGMLGKNGKLVNVLHTEVMSSSTQELADLVEKRVLAATGLSLDAYRCP